ncbi:MAG: VWA domain-containing protein [Pseudomonadota bacterium]
MSIFRFILVNLFAMSLFFEAVAQEQPEEDESRIQAVVVTAMRVTQGGAQDIEFFRETVANGAIPAPGAITSEGLFSSHDIVIPSAKDCLQLFCLQAEGMAANLMSRPEFDGVIGLGFATNIDPDNWQRDPMTIVAVVDKSGSMNGRPLRLAKKAMVETLGNLKSGDRMGVVEYGDTVNVVVPVSDVETSRDSIREGINGIVSRGSTYMEAGLELGFATAFDAQEGFEGTTRVVLFTDEQPNVGKTDSESFIGMARRASKKGVGLTTIGVSAHFGAELANKVSAARGGNLFYLSSDEDVETYFGADFDFLVSEIATDLEMTVRPASGASIDLVLGVPGEAIEYRSDGSVTMTVPSVFLSSKGGALVLGGSGFTETTDLMAEVSLKYKSVKDNMPGEDAISVFLTDHQPSSGLNLAHTLFDEFGVLQSAAQANTFSGDLDPAIDLTQRFLEQLSQIGDEALNDEVVLLNNVLNVLQSGGQTFVHQEGFVEDEVLHGVWEIARVRNTSSSLSGKSSIDLRRGDLIAFDLLEDMFNAQRKSAKRGEPEFEVESIGLDVDQRSITLWKSNIIFKYRFLDAKLVLEPVGTDLQIWLQKRSEQES